MIIIGAAVIGALLGGAQAARRKGSRWDIAHYAAGYAIAFALVGMIATVVISRSMG
ncbi:apolipoprotein acyltransferase [Chachezhania sediminis]|uniref:apolipoprotein acyltransferase n=1 Tax=Chachezhania sediminis TaxID=2599291 RepID=UPI00131CC586|nr:apolipoprotein acyltransferase [Chachezhania sediminis]